MIDKGRGRQRWKAVVWAQLLVPARAKSEHPAKHGGLLNEACSGANQHGTIHPHATTLYPSVSCACSSPPSTCTACPQPGSDPQSCSPAACLPCSTMSSSPAPLSSHWHCRIRTAASQGGDHVTCHNATGPLLWAGVSANTELAGLRSDRRRVGDLFA